LLFVPLPLPLVVVPPALLLVVVPGCDCIVPLVPVVPVPLPGAPVTVPVPLPLGTAPLLAAPLVLSMPFGAVELVPSALPVPVLILAVLSLTFEVVVSFDPLPQEANANSITLPKITFFILIILVFV
jgi:hypothetical protein